jgi:hypothetical protein
VQKGNVDMVKFLVENDASLETPEGLLHHPIASEEPDSCELLLLLLQVGVHRIRITCCLFRITCCLLSTCCRCNSPPTTPSLAIAGWLRATTRRLQLRRGS